MKFKNLFGMCYVSIVSFALYGCTGGSSTPTFTLAWSEYPSWSVFGVAHEQKLINGERGELGSIETRWGVDIVLKEVDYDTCITMYSSSTCDAVCITNMDILSPSLGRESVAVLPTSTSDTRCGPSVRRPPASGTDCARARGRPGLGWAASRRLNKSSPACAKTPRGRNQSPARPCRSPGRPPNRPTNRRRSTPCSTGCGFCRTPR